MKLSKAAKKFGLELKDCGKGHLQILGGQCLTNYWPAGKSKTVYRQDGYKETGCTPKRAVQIARGVNLGRQRNAAQTKKQKEFLSRAVTTASKYAKLYTGSIPPWDESLGEFRPN